MEILIIVAVMALIGWRLFKSGNRLGSRRGFSAGRRRRFSRRR